jgi:hypothetical protein
MFTLFLSQARHNKKGVYIFRCCYTFWFGAKPYPCLHVIDSKFRKIADKRNNVEPDFNDLGVIEKELEHQTVEEYFEDEEYDGIDDIMTDIGDELEMNDDEFDDGFKFKKITPSLTKKTVLVNPEKTVEDMMNENWDALSVKCIRIYARYVHCIDFQNGLIALPSFIKASSPRPRSKAHVNCFYGPISALEVREANLITDIENGYKRYFNNYQIIQEDRYIPSETPRIGIL